MYVIQIEWIFVPAALTALGSPMMRSYSILLTLLFQGPG